MILFAVLQDDDGSCPYAGGFRIGCGDGHPQDVPTLCPEGYGRVN